MSKISSSRSGPDLRPELPATSDVDEFGRDAHLISVPTDAPPNEILGGESRTDFGGLDVHALKAAAEWRLRT